MKALERGLLIAAILSVISVAPVFAAPASGNDLGGGLGSLMTDIRNTISNSLHSAGVGGGGSRGMPGPIAGVGLPVLIAAGAARFYRRKRRQQADAASSAQHGPDQG